MLTLLAALLSFAAPAQNAADTAQGKSGDLQVAQLASTDPDGFLKDWNQPGAGVSLTTSSATVRDKPIHFFLIFTGCHDGGNNKCDLRVDFDITDPNGQDYGSGREVIGWVKPSPEKGNFYLSDFALAMRVEKGEPLGKYRIRLTTHDLVAGTSVTTEQTISVTEAP